MALEVLLYPLIYHAALQRLGLLAAKPLLPSWRSFIPFSQSSSLLPLSIHYDHTASSLDCMKAILTCPAVFLIAEHMLERWVYACIHEVVESSIIRPDNADIERRDASKDQTSASILGLRQRSPPVIRKGINKLLTFIGWGWPLASGTTESEESAGLEQTREFDEGQTFNVGDTRVTNITPLDLLVVRTEAEPQNEAQPEPQNEAQIEMSLEEVIEVAIDAVEEPSRPTSPFTPTASIADPEDNDPRIRITNREGIVEMEVRLPPRILSSHTEAADALDSLQRDATLHREAAASARRSHHRVTRLSSEPAHLISAMVRAQIVNLSMLPIRIVALRLVASHFVAGQEGQNVLRAIRPLPSLSGLSWRSVGQQVSRIALCSALELAIDVGLWGLQCITISKIGRRVFGWGTL